MATTTNKRRFEELLECNTLHIRGIKADAEFLRSEEFESLYLRGPCSCCGSKRHSLLRIKTQLTTRSGRLQYEYQCPVASYEDIDKIDRNKPMNEIRISYWLDSNKYARECQYNKTIAQSKFKELANSLTSGYEVVMTRFKEQVLEICEETREVRVEEKKQKRESLQQESKLIFRDIFLTKPCKICGSEEHEVLINKEGTESGYDYRCPAAMAASYDNVRGRSISNRLRICPIKFALACNNDPTVVMTAYRKVAEQQTARMGEKLSRFLKSTLAECLGEQQC